MKTIVLFNNKGGVSKTTTTFNLGWNLAEKGKRVLIVDSDPQCNLTRLVFEPENSLDHPLDETRFEGRNIWDALDPVFKSRPRMLEPVDCFPVPGREGLYLLPGHAGLAEHETTLGIAQQLSESLQALRNVPGSFRYLFEETGKKYDVDYILVDVSPSLGAINQNIVTSSDSLIVPVNPDVFSVMAIESMANVIPRWIDWGMRASRIDALAEADYPFHEPNLKLLGFVVQRYRLRNGEPTTAFATYFDKLDSAIRQSLIPHLRSSNVLYSDRTYRQANLKDGYKLAEIPEFNTLIAASQACGKPVFALEPEDLGYTGVVWNNVAQNISNIRNIFDTMSSRIEFLIDNEN